MDKKIEMDANIVEALIDRLDKLVVLVERLEKRVERLRGMLRNWRIKGNSY